MVDSPEKLELEPDPSELSALRAFVSEQALQRGLSEAERFHAALIATEAVTNAIRHGGDGGAPPGPIEVTCSGEHGDLVIEVRNSGRYRPPSYGIDGNGGRGLILIASLTKYFDLQAGDDGTSLRMSLAANGDNAS